MRAGASSSAFAWFFRDGSASVCAGGASFPRRGTALRGLEVRLRKLDQLLNGADFAVGSVNCPSPVFLTVEYADSSAASFAVAINSYDLFFYRGVCFETEEDVVDLLELRDTDFYQAHWS